MTSRYTDQININIGVEKQRNLKVFNFRRAYTKTLIRGQRNVELDDSSNVATESDSSALNLDSADEHQESGSKRSKRIREFAADAPARKRLDDQWTVDEVDS
jgi:hypothetical protein